MKYKGIVKGADNSFTEYRIIYSGVTEKEARRAIVAELAKRSLPGAKAELWTMENEKTTNKAVYVGRKLTHWEVDEMFAIVEQIDIRI